MSVERIRRPLREVSTNKLSSLVLLTIFVLGVAASCDKEPEELRDVTGDNLITTADYCVINDDEIPCADTNRDGVVDIDDKDIIAAFVGTSSGDPWRDPTGDGQTNCKDQKLVEKYIGEKAPVEITDFDHDFIGKGNIDIIEGMTGDDSFNEFLGNGWLAQILEMKFVEEATSEKIKEFLKKRGYEEITPPDDLPYDLEFRRINIKTDDLMSEIRDLSEEPIVEEVHLATLARPIVDFPATPVATCQ